MTRAFATGTKAIGYCDRCGFQYLLSELRSEVVNMEETDIKACPECWDPDQPQNQLGRHQFSDPQALRNPRPTGGIAGRDLDSAYREDFSTGTSQTSPTRFDGWWVVNGTLTWTESSQSLNLVGDLSSGDPYIYRGYNGANNVPDYLSIDTSVYKYVVTQFTVNSYPLREQGDIHPPDAFQGQLYWGTGTGEPPDIPNPIDGGISQRLQRAPYFKITQPSDGFSQTNRDMASTFKIVWDLTDNADWTGTVTTLRLDYFDARPGDLSAGDIDIDYIEVVAFHNINL